MLEIARVLVNSAIRHADASLDARENGCSFDADLHARNADRVAACANRAGSFYVFVLGGDADSKAVSLLNAAETYGREAMSFGALPHFA